MSRDDLEDVLYALTGSEFRQLVQRLQISQERQNEWRHATLADEIGGLIGYVEHEDPELRSIAQALERMRGRSVAPSPPVPPTVDAGEDALLAWIGRYQDVRPLLCDRKEQWTQLGDLAVQRDHMVIFLPGRSGSGHKDFVLRIKNDPAFSGPRHVIAVHWPTKRRPPAESGPYLEALGEALGCAREEVPAALSRRLAERSVLLLHPYVSDGLDEDGLLRYYRDWLPDVLPRTRTPHALHCLQPIAWHPVSLLRRLLLLLWPFGEDHLAQRPKLAARLLRRIEREAAARIRIHRLPELHDIQRRDIEEFCMVTGIRARAEFTEIVLAAGSSPEIIIRAIAEHLEEYLPQRGSEKP